MHYTLGGCGHIKVAFLALHVLKIQHVIFAASSQTTYGSLQKKKDLREEKIRYGEEKRQQD